MKIGIFALMLSVSFLTIAAEAVTWKDFKDKNLAPVHENEACPDGTVRFEESNGRTSFGIGAQIQLEWKAAKTVSSEGTPGRCVSHATIELENKNSVLQRVRTDRCADKSLDGVEEIRLTITGERAISYRRVERDLTGKVRRDTSCELRVQND